MTRNTLTVFAQTDRLLSNDQYTLGQIMRSLKRWHHLKKFRSKNKIKKFHFLCALHLRNPNNKVIWYFDNYPIE